VKTITLLHQAAAIAVAAGVSATAGCHGGTSSAPDGDVCPSESREACSFDPGYVLAMPDGTGVQLYPPRKLILIRASPSGDTGMSCSVELPACADPSAGDACDLTGDLADPDVQDALMADALVAYGEQAFTGTGSFFFGYERTGSTVSIAVGHECAMATPTCNPTPPGVGHFFADMKAIVASVLADPACVNIR